MEKDAMNDWILIDATDQVQQYRTVLAFRFSEVKHVTGEMRRVDGYELRHIILTMQDGTEHVFTERNKPLRAPPAYDALVEQVSRLVQ